jgi:hypothetical protein
MPGELAASKAAVDRRNSAWRADHFEFLVASGIPAGRSGAVGW